MGWVTPLRMEMPSHQKGSVWSPIEAGRAGGRNQKGGHSMCPPHCLCRWFRSNGLTLGHQDHFEQGFRGCGLRRDRDHQDLTWVCWEQSGDYLGAWGLGRGGVQLSLSRCGRCAFGTGNLSSEGSCMVPTFTFTISFLSVLVKRLIKFLLAISSAFSERHLYRYLINKLCDQLLCWKCWLTHSQSIPTSSSQDCLLQRESLCAQTPFQLGFHWLGFLQPVDS